MTNSTTPTQTADVTRLNGVTRIDVAPVRCACGGKLIYRPRIGAYSCFHGSLYRRGGSDVVRACPKAKA